MPESAGFHFKIQKNFLISELENSISWNTSNLLRVEFFCFLALGLESTSDSTKQANEKKNYFHSFFSPLFEMFLNLPIWICNCLIILL